MATFIERDGDPQFPPPYEFPGVSILSFRLDAKQDRLMACCNAFLNIGSLRERGFEYRPLLPAVDLEILHYPKMLAVDPGYAGKGFTTQREVYFRFMVVKYESFSGLLFPVEMALFFPFILVDNPWSVIAGREVIGFPKNLAYFDLPGPDPYHITIATDVFSTYSIATQLTRQPFLEIRSDLTATAKPAAMPSGNWPWGDINLSAINPMLHGLVQQRQSVAVGPFSTVQLKQFRDAEDHRLACYQALVESEFTAKNISPSALHAVSITLHSFASLPIADILGLSLGAGGVLQPKFQYKIQCDLSFEDRRNVFVRCGSDEPASATPQWCCSIM